MSGTILAMASSSSGVNADCTELYKEAKRFLQTAQKLTARTEQQLQQLCHAKARQQQQLDSNLLLPPLSSSASNVGRVKSMHDITPLLEDTASVDKKIREMQRRYFELAKDERSVRKTVFFRMRHVLAALERMKLSQFYILQQFVLMLLKLVSSRRAQQNSTDTLYVLNAVDAFNRLSADAEGTGCPDDELGDSNSLLHGRRHRGAHFHENFSSSAFWPRTRQFTSSKVLLIMAGERAMLAANEVARSVVLGLDPRQLQMAAEEVNWVGASADDTALTNKLPVYQILISDDGGKKKNFRESPTSDYHSQNGAGGSGGAGGHLVIIDDFVSHEDSHLNSVLSLLAQVPGLLGKHALKSSKKHKKKKDPSTSSSRLNRSARMRMSEYYHDHLWHNVGAISEKLLLWGQHLPGPGGAASFVPFALQHPRHSLAIATLLQDFLYAKFGDGYPPVVLPCMQLLHESLTLHVVSASWDQQFLSCLAETGKPKTAAVTVDTMRSGTKASKAGTVFYDTLKSIIRLNNRCHPDMIRDFVEHGDHDPEEYPFVEERHALDRLLATLHALRNWSHERASAAVNSWNVGDFLLITQADLNNIEDCFVLLQLESHDRNVLAKAINIQLFTHVQGSLCKDIRQCQRTLREMPSHNLTEMSTICRTFSLATLQNVFPGDRYWKQTQQSPPDAPSPYVSDFIDRVLAPVFGSLQEMKIEIQQTVARVAVKAFCEAWLEHIRMRRIKFSEWGAKQISQDFTSLRQWIGSNDNVREESRRYLLLLDSLRQCEGVAKLLQAKPGELVDVKPAKNRVSPLAESADTPASPVHQILDAIPAELYVPNQQQWLSLRANSRLLSLPFCCR